MEKIDYVKLLLIKENLKAISCAIDNIVMLLDFSKLIEADEDLTSFNFCMSRINFMLDELMLKIKKDIWESNVDFAKD